MFFFLIILSWNTCRFSHMATGNRYSIKEVCWQLVDLIQSTKCDNYNLTIGHWTGHRSFLQVNQKTINVLVPFMRKQELEVWYIVGVYKLGRWFIGTFLFNWNVRKKREKYTLLESTANNFWSYFNIVHLVFARTLLMLWFY